MEIAKSGEFFFLILQIQRLRQAGWRTIGGNFYFNFISEIFWFIPTLP